MGHLNGCGYWRFGTSVPEKLMTLAEAMLGYKALAELERAFRSMKTIDQHIRPIHRHGSNVAAD